MAKEKSDEALTRVYERAQLGLSSAQRELEALRSNLGIGGIKPGIGALAAGNTACDSGCDGSCGGRASLEAAINPAELREKLTARVSAVLDAHRILGTEALSKATSGNEACDSGCNGSCAGKLADIVTQPAAGG
jgi:hypothetical protein